MGCPLLLLLFLLVAADVQAQGEAVTCAINGPALYSAETGCYPGPISSDDKSLLFRTDHDGYQVKYVCPQLGQIVCKNPWGCYSEATPLDDCMCKDPGGQSVAKCSIDTEFCAESDAKVPLRPEMTPGSLGDATGCWKNVKRRAPHSSGICEDPYIPTAPTTPSGNWPGNVGSVLHSPVSPGFFALFDAYKKSIEPMAMPSPTYVRDANHQYPDDWRITIATAPTTTTAMTTEATQGTNPTRLVVTEPSWSDEGWVQSRVFVLCLVALFVLTVYFKNKKYEAPPPVSWLETLTPEDAQRPDDPQNPAKPPGDTVKSARSSAIV
ncbi:unnamed protein product, partial [Mesorhabditis spiculigera]